jgi:DNA-binding CsgD family transcriptional regulator
MKDPDNLDNTHELLLKQALIEAQSVAGECTNLFYTLKKTQDHLLFGEMITTSTDTLFSEKIKLLAGTSPKIGTAASDEQEEPWRRGGWRIHKPLPHQLNKFSSFREDLHMKIFRKTEFWQSFYEPLDAGDQLRAIVFDGYNLVGWFGLIRRDRRGLFSEAERGALNNSTNKILLSIIAAFNLERELSFSEKNVLIVRGDTGALVSSSPNLLRSLSSYSRDQIRDYTKLLYARRENNGELILQGNILRYTALNYEDTKNLYYIIIPTKFSSINLSTDRLLSDMQRDVLNLYKMGVSEPEMAKILTTSIDNIRYHKKRIKEKLSSVNLNQGLQILGQ